MADEVIITKVHSVETVSKPTIHLLVRLETETGLLNLRVSVADAHELRGCLAQLPPNIDYPSPVMKL
jgi:hypothetical protein